MKFAGESRILRFIYQKLDMNEMWILEYMPEEFYETPISYIYKSRGNKSRGSKANYFELCCRKDLYKAVAI